jgi:GntR family transcriptional regulator
MSTVPNSTRAKASAAARPRAGTPRYQIVADALIADIERGVYAVGDLLPSELEIATRYGLSRHTTREALRCLDGLGLISRRPGIGTLVKARSSQSHYTAAIADLGDLTHHTKQTRLKVLAEEWVTIEGDLIQYLPGAQGQRWLRFRTLRYPAKGGKPISYTEIYVHPVFERIRERINEPDMMVYRLIEEQHGERVRELRQEISAIATPAGIAPLLGTAPGAPALHVVRVYLGKKDALLSVSVNIYPENRFKVTTRWQMTRNDD